MAQQGSSGTANGGGPSRDDLQQPLLDNSRSVQEVYIPQQPAIDGGLPARRQVSEAPQSRRDPVV